jgi:hypothetical protein
MKTKFNVVADVSRKVLSFVTSQRFAAGLALGVAAFQLAGAIDQFMTSSSGRKQIGFGNDKR